MGCGSNSYRYATCKLAADYKFDRDHTAYTSDSTGRHAGGFNSGFVTINGASSSLPFAPEKSMLLTPGRRHA